MLDDLGRSFSVGPVELSWLIVNLATFLFTLSAWVDARAMRKAVKALNGKALELAADTKVRAAGILTGVQALLVAAVLPQLFQPNEIRLSPTVLLLMAVAVLLLVLALSEKRDRATMLVIVAADAVNERKDNFTELKEMVQHGTDVAQQAYDAANHVKERFDAVNERIAATEDLAEARHADSATIDTIAGQVDELHSGAAPEGAS